MAAGELACTYATLLLHDDGIPITEAEKISTLVKAANVTVESYWPGLFVKLAEKRNIDDLILNAGSGGPPAVSVAASTLGAGVGAAAASTPAAEEKKEEPKEESDDDMGFRLSACLIRLRSDLEFLLVYRFIFPAKIKLSNLLDV